MTQNQKQVCVQCHEEFESNCKSAYCFKCMNVWENNSRNLPYNRTYS